MNNEDANNTADERTIRIREANDHFRKTLKGGAVQFTVGILALGPRLEAAILEAIRSFEDFTSDNDLYGEHDFGRVVIEDHEVFFKIDYFDPTLARHADDPSDTEQTERVMTIMLAAEY